MYERHSLTYRRRDPRPFVSGRIRPLLQRIFRLRAAGSSRTLEAIWSPNLDFSETDKEYVVRLEAPGIPKDDLEVNLDGQLLTLSGKRDFSNDEKTEQYFRREREQGRFVRALQLPAPVDAAKVEASYNDGVMTVRLPKREPSPKSRIPIK
jgi:HSP20 family protein